VSNFKLSHFIISLFLGKLIMIFSLSYIGYNITSFFETPSKSVVLIIVIVAINFTGKNLMEKYSRKNQ
ncbi:MAG: TVP38/TMEM64 family protein, partial [Bacillota bacterium]|nr:TVP38/TMEM64 family protein [Bacillota bacterium]